MCVCALCCVCEECVCVCIVLCVAELGVCGEAGQRFRQAMAHCKCLFTPPMSLISLFFLSHSADHTRHHTLTSACPP